MKTVVITGGNSGIGYYMTKQLLEDNRQVAVLDLEINHLQDLKKQYTQQLLCLKCDVSSEGEVERGIREVVKQFKTIDYAVHNACQCIFKSFEELALNEYEYVMKVNFFGALNICRFVIPIMKEQHAGKIFLTSSGVGVTGFSKISAYAASKGAIESFAKCMNLEYEKDGISFHIMHPALTDTQSAGPLPIPKELKVQAEVVGSGLAKRMDCKTFIICHSKMQYFQTKLLYLFPIKFGRMMDKMTAKYEQDNTMKKREV